MKPGLLVLDVQKDFFEGDNPNLAEFLRVVPNINLAITEFRKHGFPVVFIQHTSPNKKQGTPAWEIYHEIDRTPSDSCILKSFSNAFWRSDLETLLRSLDVDHVVTTGFSSEYCVLSTYRGAQERGFKAMILQNAVASVDGNSRTQFVYEISETLTHDELSEVLASFTARK